MPSPRFLLGPQPGSSSASALGTIDIYGYAMEGSAKFRNIQVNPDVAFVVDDVISDEASGVRFLEIRGGAEAVSDPAPAAHPSAQFIRIHPRRVIGWNVDPGHPGLLARDVTASGRSGTEGEPG